MEQSAELCEAGSYLPGDLLLIQGSGCVAVIQSAFPVQGIAIASRSGILTYKLYRQIRWGQLYRPMNL